MPSTTRPPRPTPTTARRQVYKEGFSGKTDSLLPNRSSGNHICSKRIIFPERIICIHLPPGTRPRLRSRPRTRPEHQRARLPPHRELSRVHLGLVPEGGPLLHGFRLRIRRENGETNVPLNPNNQYIYVNISGIGLTFTCIKYNPDARENIISHVWLGNSLANAAILAYLDRTCFHRMRNVHNIQPTFQNTV